MAEMPTTDVNKTRVDRYVAFLKNHKVFSVAFILALGIIAAASVLKSSREIIETFSSEQAGSSEQAVNSNIDKIARSMNPGLNVVIVLPDMDYEGADKDLDIAISLKLTLEKSGKNIVIKKKDVKRIEQDLNSSGVVAELPSARADYVVLVRDGVARVIDASTAETVFVGEAFSSTR